MVPAGARGIVAYLPEEEVGQAGDTGGADEDV